MFPEVNVPATRFAAPAATRPMAQRKSRTWRKKRRRVWGEHLRHRSHLGLARHARPGSILRTALGRQYVTQRGLARNPAPSPGRLAFVSDRAGGTCKGKEQRRHGQGDPQRCPAGLTARRRQKPRVDPTRRHSTKRQTGAEGGPPCRRVNRLAGCRVSAFAPRWEPALASGSPSSRPKGNGADSRPHGQQALESIGASCD